MKAFRRLLIAAVLSGIFFFYACETTVGPNEIGGDTDLELTKVGGEFIANLSMDTWIPAFDRMKDTAIITKSENGNVTISVKVGFDSVFTSTVDSLLGTKDLPHSLRVAIIDKYVKMFGAKLDTTDKQKMHLAFDLKMKVTSEGIQEYMSGGGNFTNPYTIVKYSANVGDKYEFTNTEGVKVTRTVVSKSTTDDYYMGFWMIKVIQVEQTQEDPVIEKITYVTNHKFGLVGVIMKTKTGKTVKLSLIPPNG
ncbi:MAG: hypothetical protein IPM69_18705 [Ignavibacteria bacterium]|nr:hypothetical protein [Ignavibacteria bacterium]